MLLWMRCYLFTFYQVTNSASVSGKSLQNNRCFLLRFAERNTATMTEITVSGLFWQSGLGYVGEALLCSILDPWPVFLIVAPSRFLCTRWQCQS